MNIRIQVVIEEEFGQTTTEDIVQFEKWSEQVNSVGLSLLESKQCLQALQKTIVLHQADSYTAAHQECPCCHNKRMIKSYHTIQFRTLFGGLGSNYSSQETNRRDIIES